jgi:hypothetical protein
MNETNVLCKVVFPKECTFFFGFLPASFEVMLAEGMIRGCIRTNRASLAICLIGTVLPKGRQRPTDPKLLRSMDRLFMATPCIFFRERNKAKSTLVRRPLQVPTIFGQVAKIVQSVIVLIR